jgi:hypothetical protein
MTATKTKDNSNVKVKINQSYCVENSGPSCQHSPSRQDPGTPASPALAISAKNRNKTENFLQADNDSCHPPTADIQADINRQAWALGATHEPPRGQQTVTPTDGRAIEGRDRNAKAVVSSYTAIDRGTSPLAEPPPGAEPHHTAPGPRP